MRNRNKTTPVITDLRYTEGYDRYRKEKFV